MLTKLVATSLWSRRLAVGLTVMGIALSTALILGVERVRLETRENFTASVSGTDLIVGARTSPVQLLLYSVFGIGSATNNVSWTSYRKITGHRSVAWAIPISLGDSHRGYRVIGTTTTFFEHLRYRDDRALTFAAGGAFEGTFDAVVGATVARDLGYSPGDPIVVAHGGRDDGLSRHDDLPFSVEGVLTPTGTPVDRAVLVTLAGLEAIHVGWESGTRIPSRTLSAREAEQRELEPDSVTAFYLGLNRRLDVFRVQRAVNAFPDEPLLAILPGVALTELWTLFSSVEVALIGVAAMTVVTGLLGMVVGILSTLNERRREMAVLRAVGARPASIALLLVAEALAMGLLGAVAGFALLTAAIAAINPVLIVETGLQFSVRLPDIRELMLLGVVVLAACLTAILPAWRVYRLSLHDGLTAAG